MEESEVKNRAIRGVVVLMLATGSNLVAFLILGALFSPAIIGVFVAVTALTRFFSFFTDIGLGAALIQKKVELKEADLRTVFTIQSGLIMTIVLIGLIFSETIAKFFFLSTAELWLFRVLIFTLFISSLKTIPAILLERKLAFGKQVIPQILELLVFNILVVILAYRGFGVTAYTWATLAAALSSLPLYYLLSPWAVGLGFDWRRGKQLISFGLAYQAKTFLSVVKDELWTAFLLGLVGRSGIGYWSWAHRWAHYPYRLFVDNVTKVTFPAYARIQENKEALRQGIEKSLFVLSLVLFPIYSLMILLAKDFLLLIPRYNQWLPALPSFYLLCFLAGITAYMNILVNSLDATGKVKTTLALMLLWIATIWGSSFYFVPRFGFNGIALSQSTVALTLILVIFLAKRNIPFNFVAQLIKPLLASLGMVVVVLLPLPLLFRAAAGGIIYLVLIILLAKREVLEGMTAFRQVYSKK